MNETAIASVVPGDLGLVIVAWISGLFRGRWSVLEPQGWELKAAADFLVPSEFDWERWSAVTKCSKIAGNSV